MNIDEFCQQMKKETALARQYNRWTKGGVWKMVITENEEAKVIYRHIAALARSAYEEEKKREESIIEQAGRMQSAFSFVIAALFMLAQILLSYTILSSAFLIASISSVSITLLL